MTYFSSQDVTLGSIVKIPLRNKKILGLAVAKADVSNAKSDIKDMSFQLRKILEIKENSIFKKEFIEAAILLSIYFVSKKNIGVASLIPSLFREKYDEIAKFVNIPHEEETEPKNIKSEKLIFQTNLEDRLSYYKTLIRGQFALRKSIFIVLPTEYDIEIFEKSLSKGVEKFVFSLHGGLKPKEILERYKQIMYSAHGVLVICTPQYLSIPLFNIEYIVISIICISRIE